MRHHRAGRRLGRDASHRKALMRTLVTQFLDRERLITTVPKAKELRPFAEKIITLAKRETLHARRQALAVIRKKTVVSKLFETLAPRFADRNGGYCRIVRLGVRKGDAAELAIIELIGSEYQPAKPAKGGKKAAKGEAKKGEAKKSEAKKGKAEAAAGEKKSKTKSKKAEEKPASEEKPKAAKGRGKKTKAEE
ncbi:MAG: 50S ribosomal protein L17 [Acidobacteria bacterium]|nr:MAG: 50S ribosomal protein L17 [Acidobacteriota bacterium]